MKILFVDSYTSNYDTTTHLKTPLGGTQSAVSGLAKALAAGGHRVSVINGVPEPIETDGVQFRSLPVSTPDLNEFDVVIPVSNPMAKTLRDIGCNRPLVLWSHHAADQPAVQRLQDPSERSLFAGTALVSAWQVANYAKAFNINLATTRVMRNAVSTPFLKTSPSLRWLKTEVAPVLAYSSTPFRGLDILLLSFASICRKMEGAKLLVFSGMGIYGPDVEDEYSSLYDLCNKLPGVTYVGPLPQSRLAEEMANVDIWAYPCTFAETSCISAMEAMVSGALPVTSTLGALPETTGEFGRLVDLSMSRAPGVLATRFAAHLVNTATEFKANPQAAETTILKQINFARENYNWEKRAVEWTDWLAQII